MIRESAYWKEELTRASQYLVLRLESTTWNDRSLGKLEKTIMISLYIIRKLAEAQKIPTSFLSRQIMIQKYKAKEIHIDHINRVELMKKYDMQNSDQIKISVSYLLNQIIHSFVYMPLMDRNDKILGLLFNSDRTKDRELYMIKIKDIISLIATVSTGSIISMRYKLVDGGMELVETIYKNDWDRLDVKH